MTLKTKFYSLAALLHLILLVAAYWYIDNIGFEFILVELFLLTSLLLFFSLIRKVIAPFQYVDLFNEVLSEEEFTTRFSHTGNRELDNLMRMFNHMLNQLYEERLKLGDRKGMLSQLLDAIPLSIIVFDYDEKVSQLNPAAEALFNADSTTAKGTLLKTLHHPLSVELAKLQKSEVKLISDEQGNRFRCQKTTFKDKGFERSFIVIQEITSELKSSEKRTYEKLIRMMSHEVNNTMAATSSMLRACLDYADDINPDERDDYKKAMQLVIERTNNLNHFMQDYAQIVRLPKPSIESCNIYHLLLSQAQLFDSIFREKHISVNLQEIKPESCTVQADRKQIEQVLINLIKNAVEAIGEKGEIGFQLQQLPQGLKLQIKDSGPGLSMNALQDLFSPFFTTKQQGQGIGLMLVKDILDAHQFAFRLFNHEQGGACFEIIFSQP